MTQSMPGVQRLGGGGPSLGLNGQQIAEIAKAIEGAAARGTIATSAPYFSRILFRAERVGAAPGPYTYTIPQGSKGRFFGYGLDDNVVIIGDQPAAPLPATEADTNLTNKGQTVSGQTVYLQGLSMLFQGETDWELARALAPETSLVLKTNGGQQSLRLGTFMNMPAIGGFYGQGRTGIKAPALAENVSSSWSKQASNGMPFSDNFRRIPEGFTWRQGNKQDGNLVIEAEVQRDVVVTGDADRAAVADVAQAFEAPDFIIVDVIAHIIGIAVTEQSVNL